MIRRPRFNLKPNIRPGGRGPGPAAPAPTEPLPEPLPEPADSASQHVSESPAGCASPSAVKVDALTPEEKPRVLNEKETVSGNETQQAKVTPAPFQRRKRISTLPNLAKPRVSAATPSSQKPSSVETPSLQTSPGTPVKNEVTPPEEKLKPLCSPRSPTPQGPHPPLPDKKTPVPLIPQFSPYKKPLKQQEVTPVKAAEPASLEELCPLKERPSQDLSINGEPVYRTKPTPAKKIVGDLERERLRRAQKLRDLLRDELRKERRVWKEKHPVIIIDPSIEPERSKMTMRDFVHFIPVNNPMTSSAEERRNGEKSLPAESQLSTPEPKNLVDEDDDLDEAENDSQLVVPRVKVAEDGSIILDEESLTVEVSRAKAAIVEENDPIFERGSTTTYSSFRKSSHAKPWSDQETEMFFLAISMVGTDFSMIGQLFPHRERTEIKNKFKREERANGWRIDKAFREKKAFDFEFFAKLLERALEAKNKKQKSPRAKKPQEKKSPKPRKKKDKKADEQKSCVSDGDGVNLSEGEAMDSRTAEKENEESPCLKETSACLDSVPAKKKRKRKKEADSVVSEEEKCLKKGAKSRKKNKSTSGEDDHASDAAEGPSEREVTGNEEQLNTEGIEVPEKKRRGRKRKDDAKVSEKELQPEEGADTAPITKKSKARGKRKSVTFEKNDDVESIEDALDSSKGACTTSEEIVGNDGNDSVLLFSEDCENALESGFLTSTQMSASDAPAFEVLQSSDLTINDESKLTPPCDCQEPTSQQSANQEEPTSEEASDLMNGTDKDSAPKEPDSPTKDTKAQIPHPVRGRLVKPKPNLAKFSGKERAAGKVESSSDTKNDPSTRSEEVPLISSTSDAKSSEGDIENEEAAAESELLSAKPAAVVRGRLQSPKPNLTKSSARKESVAGAEEKRDNREAASEHPNNISPYSKESPSHAGKHADKQMDVSNVDVHSSQGEPASVTVSNPPPEHSHTSELEHPLSKTSDSSLADVGKERSQMGNAQTEKVPDQTVRRGLLRPRPNLAKAPPRNKPIQSLISEQTDQTGQISGEAGIASASTERVETPGLEKKTEEEMKTEEPPVSEDERKRCPTKATPLAQSRFQKPRPNLSRTPTRSGNQEKAKDTQEQNMEQSTRDASRTSLHQTDGQHISTKEGSQTMDVTVDGNITLDASSVPVHITPPSDACSLAGSVPDRLDHDCASGRPLVDKSLASQDKCVKSPVKPTPLACGRFARLKPNIGSASSARTRKANVEPSVQSIEPVADEPSLKSHSSGRDTPGFEKREDQQREVSVTDNHVPDCPASVCFPCKSPENSRSEAGHLESAPAHEAPEEIMKDSTLEEASVKPEPVTQPFPVRGRLQRPKPNIQRAAAKRGALVPTGAAKDEAPVHVQRNIDKKLSPDGPVSAPCASDCKQALPSNIQPIKAGPSAILKPAILKRGRFQGQNLLGAAAKRDLPASQSSDGERKEMGPSAISTNTMSNISMCEDAKSPLTCTLSAETQNNQLDESTAVTTLVEDVEDEPGEGDKRPNKDDSRETATKPAEQRRGRLMRPKPNLGRVTSRKESRAEGEAEKRVKIELNESSQEKAGKEQLPDNDNHFSDSPGIKGNACATSIIVSPKKRQSSTTERKQVCAIEDVSLGSRESQNNLSRAPQIGLSAGQQTVIPSIEVDSASAKGDPDSAVTQRSRYGRQLKKPVIPPPSVPSKASENKTEGSGKEKSVRSTKTTSSKSKSANSISKTAKGKTTLVTLRASQEDDEEEEEDVETEFGDEDYNLAPDMVNQAPVFVPFSLRSPKPVTSEIEETVEELELPMEILEVQSIDDHERCVGTTGLLPGAQAPAALSSMSEPDNTDHIDGSTEAAMTLISMRNPAYQPIADTSGASAQENQNDLKTLSEKQAPTFLTSADQDYKGHMQNARSGINDGDVPSIALGTTGRLEEVSTGIILMQCLQSQSPDSRFEVQSVNPLDGSCGAEFEQVTYPGIQDPEPCYSVSQNDETSGNIDKSVNPEMETTFILTLVEIPLNSEYQYPGETCNPELPAPVMVSTASAHTVFSSETPSTEIVAGCDSFTSAGSETATGALNQIPWKTQQSSSDGDGTGPATKKVLLQEHLQENQPTGTEIKVVQDGSTPAVASSQEVTLQTADIQSEGVAPTANLTQEEEPASFSAGRDSLGNNIHLPTELSALPSKTSLTRPGKKPLGILGLVCQEKGKRKAKDVKSKKKPLPKLPCRKPSLSAHKSKIEIPMPGEVSAPTKQVPSSTTCPPSNVPVHPAVDIIKPVCEDSDNQVSKPQEPLSPHEDISEEAVATVSEYFFDDIFMAVDDE